MTVPAATGETVTLITRTVVGEDGDGNDVYGDVPTTYEGCWFDPGYSSEQVQGQDQVTAQPQVGLPEGATLPTAVDKVTARGVTYDVDGRPEQFHNPFSGWQPGIVIRLKAVTG